MRARVRNTGRSEAAASVARLYDGSPDSSPSVGEVAVAPLAPGQEVEVSFDLLTTDRPGPRTLYVVADAAEEVAESREDDNAASRLLTVAGLLADLVVTSSDILLSPAAPEVGEATTITVTVSNRGARASTESQLRLSVIHLFAGTSVLPDVSIPPLVPGETSAVAVPWTPTAIGEQILRATADANYAVPESNETNGSADRPVEVLAAAPDGVELSIPSLTLAPSTLQELPQVLEARVVVENAGRSSGSTSLELLDDESGEILGVAPVDLGPRESVLVTLSMTIRTPGTRLLVAVVDPDGLIPEETERDNEREATLFDEGTLDVEISSASLSSPDVERGDTVTVAVDVANRGTRDLIDIPIQLVLDSAEGPSELTRTVVTLGAGQAVTVSLLWQAALEGDALPLRVRADPFDLLAERREDNNERPLVLQVRPTAGPNLAVSGADIVIDPEPPVEGDAAS